MHLTLKIREKRKEKNLKSSCSFSWVTYYILHTTFVTIHRLFSYNLHRRYNGRVRKERILSQGSDHHSLQRIRLGRVLYHQAMGLRPCVMWTALPAMSFIGIDFYHSINSCSKILSIDKEDMFVYPGTCEKSFPRLAQEIYITLVNPVYLKSIIYKSMNNLS